jgi:hypothetical protein
LLTFDPKEYAYELSAKGRAALQPIFNNWRFDVSEVSFSFAGFTGGVGAFTVGNSVMINSYEWVLLDPLQRLQTLAHEITHSVPYRDLGYGEFAARYGHEAAKLGLARYDVPLFLYHVDLSVLNVTDKAFALDQIAARVEHDVK